MKAYKISIAVERYDTEMIEIMCCAVKQAATGENPVGRTSVRRGAPPTKETRVHGDERVRISEAFIPTLPKLLTRVHFSCEAEFCITFFILVYRRSGEGRKFDVDTTVL